MTTPLQPVITSAGLAAIWRADNKGIAAEITHIGLGTTGYTPNKTQTALRTRKGLYPISDGEKLSSTLLHLTAIADDDLEYWVREVGFYLSDGTLLAVWSDPATALAYKSPTAQLLLAYDLSLSALPADSVVINSTGAGLNLTLAEPLAAQASALVAEMMRGVQQQDQLETQSKQLRVVGELLGNLTERMKEVEARQELDREGMLTAIVANATALINLQNLFSQKTLGA
ncbi:phage tail protein [Pseudomonas entomophila]|uniref:phage tail-collar fiber domain-containing protein n=1 Tax=Pseudomonas entomophila TaxID=312306 RepID=UPI0015E4753A|nr:phage tail protein [Pseudomonas entomophila]MBA1194875.1 phage tail protein [Pseudomonas entomophila]